MKIDYLISTHKKTDKEIEQIIIDSNLHNASIIIGNQCCERDYERIFTFGDNYVKVIYSSSKGVSRNRNELLLKATADYITFLDDDIYFEDTVQKNLDKYIDNHWEAFRVNVVSDNPQRAIKQYNTGKLGFFDLKSVGVWGIFYKRELLISNNFRFELKVGPGAQYPAGEDSIFHRSFLKKYKVIQTTSSGIHAKQVESTWQGVNRNERNELIGNGYTYSILFGFLAFPFGIYHIIKHKKNYNTKFIECIKYFSIGVKAQRGEK